MVHDIHSVPATRELWAVCDNGKLLFSADDGRSWNSQGLPTNRDLRAVTTSSDGSRVIAVGEQGFRVRGRRYGRYSNVTGVRTIPHPLDVQIELQLTPDTAYGDTPIKNVRLWATTDVNSTRRSWQEMKITQTKPGSQAGTWGIEFDPGQLNLQTGAPLFLETTFRTSDLSRTTALPAQQIRPWGWVEDHLALLISASGLALYGLGILVLFLIRPLWLLSVYRSALVQTLIESFELPVVGILVKQLIRVTLLPHLVQHERTLNAWVTDRIQLLLSAGSGAAALVRPPNSGTGPTVREGLTDLVQWTYVALPVTLEQAGVRRTVREPSAREFPQLFSARASIVQIVGPGGAGKSTLAWQLANWILQDGAVAGGWPTLPIMLGEETADLRAAISGRILSIFGETLDESFLAALLEKGRILVIADSLSEWRPDTQKYFKDIHQQLPLHSLLITTRMRIDFSTHVSTVLSPQALNSATLLTLMTALVNEWRRKQDERAADFPHQIGIVEQLHLGTQLAKLTGADTGDEIPITPLLVTLFVERAIELYSKGGSLENLPSSIPDLYFDYLRVVNPNGTDSSKPDVPNWLPDNSTLSAVAMLAKLALGDDLILGSGSLPLKPNELSSRAVVPYPKIVIRCSDSKITECSSEEWSVPAQSSGSH